MTKPSTPKEFERLGVVLRRVLADVTPQRNSPVERSARWAGEGEANTDAPQAGDCRAQEARLKDGPTSSGGRNVGPCREGLVGGELGKGRGTFDFGALAPARAPARPANSAPRSAGLANFNSAGCAGIV